MKLPRRNLLYLAASAAALPAVSRIAWAQNYPTRPVRIIVGFPAGGPTDIVARVMAQWLSERLGQQFVVENRAGAASNIGTEAALRAPPDGYTLLQVTSSMRSMRRFMKISASISSTISRPSEPSSASPSSWRSTPRCRRGQSPSSSPTPRPIRAGSIWHPAVPEHRSILPASSSR